LVSLLLVWLSISLLLGCTLRSRRSLCFASVGSGWSVRSIIHVLLWRCINNHKVVLTMVVVYIRSHEIQFEVVISLLDIVKLLLFYRALILFIMLYIIIINCLVRVEMVYYFYVLTCLSTLSLVPNWRRLALLLIFIRGVWRTIYTLERLWGRRPKHLVVGNKEIVEIVLATLIRLIHLGIISINHSLLGFRA